MSRLSARIYPTCGRIKSLFMKSLIVIGLLFLSLSIRSQSTPDTLVDRHLTSSEMLEDFNLFRRILQETHPGLYRYTPKEIMQAKLDSIAALLQSPRSFYSYYQILAALSADIRCEHTHVLPTADIDRYLRSEIQAFPLFLYPIQDRLYVLFNGTQSSTIQPGVEITRINQYSSDEIKALLKRHFWADGYNEPAKKQVLKGGYFSLFYYTIVERPESFVITYRDLQGKTGIDTLPALSYETIERNYIRNPLNEKMMAAYNKKYKQPWRLSFPADVPSTAILRFDGFGKKGIHSTEQARTAFQKFMNQSMRKIQKKDIQSLIIDVRSNSGGWDVQGVELLTYLVKSDTAFKYYRQLHTITDDSEFLAYSDLSAADRQNPRKYLEPATNGIFVLKETQNPLLGLQYPKPNRFRGEVYILMDEGSASAASEFLALAKSQGIGTLIGTSGSGAYNGSNSSVFIRRILPHSGIQVSTPLVFYQNAVQRDQNPGSAIQPHHQISMQLEDLLNNYDRQLEFAKELIRKAM